MNNYFKVLRPGINSTFQDLGRFGLQHLGIVASGCMDQLSFCISNKLVGNKISEGALEFAYQGPLLELVGDSVLVAISGKVNFNIIKKNRETIQGTSNESFIVSDGDQIDILSKDLKTLERAVYSENFSSNDDSAYSVSEIDQNS